MVRKFQIFKFFSKIKPTRLLEVDQRQLQWQRTAQGD